MTPLPAPLGDGALVAWRLDDARFAETGDSGEGAFRVGGQWNNPGVRAVYCSLDPATAILEVAVHKGFATLDVVPHVLTAIRIPEPEQVHVVKPNAIPNPNWLRAGFPSAGQQAFGDALLASRKFIALPSAVSSHSWNLIFVARTTAAVYRFDLQERFALDTRLHPPKRPTR